MAYLDREIRLFCLSVRRMENRTTRAMLAKRVARTMQVSQN
ncbi:MAG TPA: hypothetical protein VFB38_11800 [Chthonomonadaceae bacterium]|nr:hypothetical protein [Chthonomonadaceae bacterium]